jgi:hypothetical protein
MALSIGSQPLGKVSFPPVRGPETGFEVVGWAVPTLQLLNQNHGSEQDARTPLEQRNII